MTLNERTGLFHHIVFLTLASALTICFASPFPAWAVQSEAPAGDRKEQADRLFHDGRSMLNSPASRNDGYAKIEQAYTHYRDLQLREKEVETLRYLVDIRADHHLGPERAREIIKLDAENPPDPLIQAKDYFRLGLTLYYAVKLRQATYEESDLWLKKALRLLSSQRSVAARQLEASVASVLGITYGIRADIGNSERFWKLAEQSANKGGGTAVVYQRLVERATGEANQGYYHKSWVHLQTVIDWGRQQLQRLDRITSWDQVRGVQNLIQYALERQGVIASHYGRYEQAIALEQQAIRAGRTGWVSRLVACETNITRFRGALGQPRLERNYRQLIRMAPSQGDPTNYLLVREAYADYLISKRRYPEALAQLKQVRTYAIDQGFLHFVPECHIAVGDVRIRLKQWDDAQEEYAKAWKLVGKYDLPAAKWRIYVGQGRALEGLGRRKEALKEYEKATRELNRFYRRVSPGVDTSSAEIAGYVEPYEQAFDLRWQLGDRAGAFRISEESRSRMLLQAMIDGVDANRSASLTSQGNTRISRTAPAHSRASGIGQPIQTTPISYSSLTGLARSSGSVILNYAVTEGDVYLFVADSRGVYPYHLNINRQELEVSAQRLQKELSSPHGEAVPELAGHLYAILIGVAESHIRAAKVLCIVPDGPLWNVPFAALVRDRKGVKPYLVQRYPLTYAPSATALREILRRDRQTNRPQFSRARQVAVLCNPTARSGFQNRQYPASFRSLVSKDALKELPWADREASRIRSVDPLGTSVYHGVAATTERAQMALSQFSTVHFASHAGTVKSSPMSSYLVLAPGATGSDGVLEARDLAGMKIRSRLVVFAACKSAQGRNVSSEGLVGLTWAAFVGGATSQMAALWDVQELSSPDMMARFYRYRSKGGRTAYALQRTQCDMIQRGYRPFQWAPFIVTGVDTSR